MTNLNTEPMALHSLSFARKDEKEKAVITFHVVKGEYFVSPVEMKRLWGLEAKTKMPFHDFISFLEKISETDLLEQIERHT